MNFRISSLKGALCLLAILFASCGGDPGPKEIEIVATSTMVTDMVETIAGPDVKVTGLMAAGVDPHTYEPPANVYSSLRLADLIIYNGLHLEGKLTDSFEKRGDSSVALTDHLPKDQLISAEEIDEEFGDPHIWGDAALWAQAVPVVVEKLTALIPEKKEEFDKRGAEYQKQIEDLHEWIKTRIAELPAENRILITSHDAFNYFGRAYEIQVIGVQGISTVDEAGMAEITKTIDLIKEKKIKAIFPESSVPPAIIDRISKDSGAVKGQTLFSDSTGEKGKTETMGGETYDIGTYVGMMKHNVNAIVDALK